MNDSTLSEESLFSNALALPAADRPAYLDQACAGHPALRARVEALLRAHKGALSLLEGSPGSAAPTAIHRPTPVEQPGTMIGRYKLLQQIGEGGCGTVYMAEQQQPVVRRVALKVIKLGMDTKEVIARFEAERQALAMMDHPNIAKVLDAGSTDTGRPYFVMELVRGVPITKYCDEQRLPTPARLGLFTQVCHAIQHAHQKGIIHRDIKPSNILVTINDGVPVPKVIDFGIAKATQGRLTNSTVFTAFEHFVGTPAYMSPEQAVMTSLDVDTRSDIYSLGVLLYELLTGRTPFEAKDLMQAGLDEMRRLIREVEPARPSTRLGTLEKTMLTTTAQHRHTDAQKLVSQVGGDLDWIVMRCLEKDRTRRYDTANSLADDIGRHLGNEPIVARPASTAYRLQKLVARNKLAVGAATVVACAVIAGLIVSTWAYLNEKTSRQFAVETALQHKKTSDQNRTIMIRAADSKRQADASDKKAAVEIAKSTYAVAVMNDLTRDAGSGSAAEKMRMRARLVPTIERLRQDVQILPEAKQELCDTIGDLCLALDDLARAEDLYRQRVVLLRTLRSDGHPDTVTAVNKLIEALKRQGKDTEATKTLGQAQKQREEFFRSDRWAKQLKTEARDLQVPGKYAEAEAKLREAMANAQARLGADYNLSEDLGLLARLRYDAGDFPGAGQLAEQCIFAEKSGRRWAAAGTLGSFSRKGGEGTSAYQTPYDAHTVLGLIALNRGDKTGARAHLLQSAYGVTRETKFERQEVELAAALIGAGEQKTVIQFLDHVRPRYIDPLEARNFTNSIFSATNEFYSAALARQRAQELGNWKMEMSVGKIPADWERLLVTDKPSAPATVSPLPPGPKSLVGLPISTTGLYRPLFPFAFLMLGWCATALAPRFGSGRHIPAAAAAWLIAFCVMRTLDGAIFTGMILRDGYLPSLFGGIYVSFVSWMLLWEFIRALVPGESSRWERRIMRSILAFGLLEMGAMKISGYISGSVVLAGMSALGIVLLLLLTFVLAFGICIAAGRRLWVWQRNADLTNRQRLCLKFAVPLLVGHGYISIFAGIIHDNSSPAVAGAIFWATALLPWLLAVGFFHHDHTGPAAGITAVKLPAR